MKKFASLVIILVLAILIGIVIFQRKNEIPQGVEEVPAAGSNDTSALSQRYANASMGIELRFPSIVALSSEGYPESYKVDESYAYQLTPEKQIKGIKFVIPKSYTKGTNLSSDSYIAVESLPKVASCTADQFLDGTHPATTINDAGVKYSFTESSGAGAGNRYEETIYAIHDSNPCIAIRYLIHYTAVQNYDPGTVQEFNKEALLREFDSIRRTLVVQQ